MQLPYTVKAKKAVTIAGKMSKSLHHNYIGTEHLLIGLLKENSGVAAKILNENGVELDKIVDLIKELIAPAEGTTVAESDGYSPRAAKVLENAEKEAVRFHADAIGTEHILIAMIKETDCVASRLLTTLSVNMQKVFVDTLIAMGEDANLYREEFQNGRPGKKKNNEGTPTLDQYSRDLTQLATEGALDPVVGREEEIQRVIQILSRRTKNNPCLIGEPGVGKTAIVEGIAERIVSGLVPDSVQGKRVVSLDLSGIVAGSKYRGEFEERMKRLLREVKYAGNVILFLDEVHTIIGAGGAEGAMDASNILKPSLARGDLQLIGATTIAEYRKYIEKDAALERRFQPVMVEEPSQEECMKILKGIVSKYETHHHVSVTEEALQAAVQLSARYINDRNLPDKAIDIIDEACSKVSLGGFKVPENIGKMEEALQILAAEKESCIKSGDLERASSIHHEQEEMIKKLEQMKKRASQGNRRKQLSVTENDIASVVSAWTKIPLSKLKESESTKLRKLEQTLHKRVVGQEEAVTAVAKAVRRGRVGLKDPKRPIGSFLFLGPTGVGKTELSKALAEALFGDEEAMIRIDMSEYMEKHSVSKMIGSPPGYVGHEDGGQLSEKVRRNPYSVILFDEIEKAHPDVFNILLQVLDDGHITDSQGRKVDFRNTVIIMTSNAGAKSIIEPKKLGFIVNEDEAADYKKMKSNVMEEVKQLFRPEFLNRIDEIIVFHALNKDHMKKITGLMCREFAKRAKEYLQIELHIRDSVKQYIVEKGTDRKFGARPLRRAVQTYLEDKMAEEILDQHIQSGMDVDVTVAKGEIKFIPKNIKN